MKSLSSSFMNKKTFASIIAVLSIVGYGYFAFAVILPGQTLDPVGDNLCTGPLDPDCAISQAWEQNLDDGFVFNLGSNIGIGTDTPNNILDISGDVQITNTTSLADQVNKFGLDLTSTITSSGTIEGSFVGLNNIITYTGTADVTSPSFFYGPLAGSVTGLIIDPIASGVLDTISGSSVLLFNQGAITTPQLVGLNVISANDGVGSNIEEIIGLDVSASSYIANPTGIIQATRLNLISGSDIREIYPVSGSAFQYDGTAGFAIALQYNVIASLNGVIDKAISITPRVFTESTGIINSATGIEFSGTAWSDSIDGTLAPGPAVQSVGDARGIHFTSSTIAPLGTISAIESQTGTAYGIQIGLDALDGATGEYGLFIADGQNYLSNGVRLSLDTANTTLFAEQNGLGYELYFGDPNDIVVTMVDTFTPSDERFKTNINESSLSLEDLLDIEIVDFTYNQDIIQDDNQQHHGVIAQQLETIYPNAVLENRSGYKMVDYNQLVPLTIKAIQELDLKLENIQSASTVVVSGGLSLNSIRDWLGDVGNGITRIVADRLQARNEICIDDVCMNKEQLRNLLITQNGNNSGSQNNESDQGVQGNQSDVDNNVNSESEEQADTESPSNLPDQEESLEDEIQEESLEDNSLQNEQEIVSETPSEDSESTIQE